MNVGGRRGCPNTRTPPPGAGLIGLAHTTSTRIDGRGERSRRERVFDPLDSTLDGSLPRALDLFGAQRAAGADPAIVLEDMLALSHWLTRIEVAPELAADPGVPEAERVRARGLAEKLAAPELTLCWRILLKLSRRPDGRVRTLLAHRESNPNVRPDKAASTPVRGLVRARAGSARGRVKEARRTIVDSVRSDPFVRARGADHGLLPDRPTFRFQLDRICPPDPAP